MPGTLTLGSWPGTTGDPSISYFNHYLEQFQFVLPPGVLPSRNDDILGAYTNELKPIGDSTGMQVKIYQGRATAKGVFAHINDADVSGGVYTLTVTAAHATLYRIDSVIVRFDLTNGGATLRMLDGTAAVVTAAIPAALTQSATTWDVLLGYVFVSPAVVTIAAADVCDQRVFSYTPRSLMEALAIENPIINGGMEVWNDGTTFTSIASGTFGPEMWQYQKAGAGVHDLLQAADVPAVAETVQKDNFSLHLDVTTADASIVAGDVYAIWMKIEGRRMKRLLQRGFTLPFWVKDSIIGPHAVAFFNGGADRYCVCEYVISQADTWELHYVHVPPSPTAGTWDYTTGTGLYCVWTLAAGSTYQTATPGAWGTGALYGTARTVNSMSSTANNFKLWGVGPMSLGGLVLPFSPHDDELALCRRYYEVMGGDATTESFGNGNNFTTTSSIVTVDYDPKRVVPSLSVSAASDFQLYKADGTTAALTAFTPSSGSKRKYNASAAVASGLVAGNATEITAVNTNARLKINARLP